MKSRIMLTLGLGLGMAFSLDAQNDAYFDADPSMNAYVDFGRSLDVDNLDTLWNSDALTISMWMRWWDKEGEDVGQWATLLAMSDSSGSSENGVFWLQHDQWNSRLQFVVHASGKNSIQSLTTVEDSTWYHIAVVIDWAETSNNMKLYINGVCEATTSVSGSLRTPPNKTRMTMARWPHANNDYRKFRGHMDEVSMWTRALNDEEVDSLMHRPESVTGEEYDSTGLLAYWNFDIGNANDLSVNQIDGTVYGVDPFGVLPVELLTFEGFPFEESVMLHWETASEINNAYFVVQRSTDAFFWDAIAQVEGAGNSRHQVSYTIQDFYANMGVNYYRLKQVDIDGRQEYSETIVVDVTSKGMEQEVDITLFTNHLGTGLMIMAAENTPFSLAIYNHQGLKLMNLDDVAEEGSVLLMEGISSGLPAGVYIIAIRYNNKGWTAKFQP